MHCYKSTLTWNDMELEETASAAPLWSRISKGSRCRLAGCPVAVLRQDLGAEMAKLYRADESERDDFCSNCRGPVMWADPNGVIHGRCRSCSSCPMSGKGLPVCWAACPGPNDAFQADGQSMETLGAMCDAEALIYNQRETIPTDENEDAVNRISISDDRGEDDEPSHARSSAHGIADEDWHKAVNVMNLVFATGGRRWEDFVKAAKSSRPFLAADIIGASRALFRGADAIGTRIAIAIASLCADGDEWDMVRSVAAGNNIVRTARLRGITKQAVSKRLKHILGNGSAETEGFKREFLCPSVSPHRHSAKR